MRRGPKPLDSCLCGDRVGVELVGDSQPDVLREAHPLSGCRLPGAVIQRRGRANPPGGCLRTVVFPQARSAERDMRSVLDRARPGGGEDRRAGDRRGILAVALSSREAA